MALGLDRAFWVAERDRVARFVATLEAMTLAELVIDCQRFTRVVVDREASWLERLRCANSVQLIRTEIQGRMKAGES